MNDAQRYLRNGLVTLVVLGMTLFLFGFAFAAAVPDGWAAWRVGICFGLVAVVVVVIATAIFVLDSL